MIQDVGTLKAILWPHLNNAYRNLHARGVQRVPRDCAFQWIIAEELELIYGLFCEHHVHNAYEEVMLYSELRSLYESESLISLSQLIAKYVRGPRVYNENNCEVLLRGRDLYIVYYTRRLTAVEQLTDSLARIF